MDTEEAVVLAILLNKGGGITHKSPDYITEKVHSVQHDWLGPERLLDSEGRKIFEEWRSIWRSREVANWKKTVDIKPLLVEVEDDDNQGAQRVAQSISTLLKASLPEYPDIDHFEEVTDVEDCNEALDRLYNWADKNLVWLGI